MATAGPAHRGAQLDRQFERDVRGVAMKPTPNLYVERYRIRSGSQASDAGYGNNGAFLIPGPMRRLRVIISDGEGWEHASVSLPTRCPNWQEMAYVKDLFWLPTETVVQFHPRSDQYVNNHPYCLHLWRKSGVDAELPPSWMVGIAHMTPDEIRKLNQAELYALKRKCGGNAR